MKDVENGIEVARGVNGAKDKDQLKLAAEVEEVELRASSQSSKMKLLWIREHRVNAKHVIAVILRLNITLDGSWMSGSIVRELIPPGK